MLKRLRNLIGSAHTPVAQSDKKERIMVATCVVLLEMAHADGEFHEMEAILVKDLIHKKFDLTDEDWAELKEFAEKEREGSIDLYQFTRQINENFTREEKINIVESLWRIIYADGVIDKYEDYLIRRLATLLRLSHKQMIEAKVNILNEIARENIK